MRLYIVDVFTTQRFGGNTAGVVLLNPGEPFPDDAFMQQLAAELRYSETVFVYSTPAGEYTLRYFTPTEEVDLCGHATVGAFWVLREAGALGAQKTAVYTKAGVIGVLVSDVGVMVEMCESEETAVLSGKESAEIYAAIGLDSPAQPHLPCAVVCTGLADLIVPVASVAALRCAAPDLSQIRALSAQYGVVGMHVFAFSAEKSILAECRNFAPLVDIPEEAATGTATASLSYYLYRRNLMKTGERYLFSQGQNLNRPSCIHAAVRHSPARTTVEIGGGAVIVCHGEVVD